MPTLKLTDRAINRKPPTTGTLELWDTVVPGLALRIGYGGKRAYCVTTRLDRKQIRRTIGSTATHSLAEARDAARTVIRDAAKGVDSASKQVREQERQEAARTEAGTFRSVAEAWLADTHKGGGAKLRSKKTVESQLRRDAYPKIGALPIASITKADIRALVDGIARERPIAANRGLATVRRIFNWAVAKDRLPASPAVGIEPPGEETSRDRVLRNGEIAKLWRAFDELGYPFGHVFKLLLLTGARRNEVGGITWSEIEDDTWHLAGERTKNGRPHLVPLSTLAKAVIDAVPRMDDSDYLFTTNGHRPVSGWGRAKERIDAISAVENWRLHDIRRTVVTGMAEMDIDPHVIEACVNHISGAARSGVAGIYNRATYLPQRTAALEAWANHIMGLVGEASDDNVIDLRGTK